MSLLDVRDLDVRYGGIRALNGISLHVDEGEIVTLLGANGAGKTTTLRAISGLVRPHSGEIAFEGSSLLRTPPHAIAAMGIGHVPEGRRVFPRMTVRENLELGAYTVASRKTIAERMDEALATFPRLKERFAQKAGTRSGGEQQMLAIARALMASPRLLLLDEPSLGLSPILVQTIFAVIAKIHERGTTILLVEQNARQALRIASRGYVLENGAISREAPAAQLLEDEAVVAAYLGGCTSSMWQPFAEHLRKSIVLAQDEAQRTGGGSIGTGTFSSGWLPKARVRPQRCCSNGASGSKLRVRRR